MLGKIKYVVTFKWYHGFIKGSRSLDFQALSAFCLYAELNLGLVEKYLGAHYDLVLLGFIGANVFFRFITKNKLGAKKIG